MEWGWTKDYWAVYLWAIASSAGANRQSSFFKVLRDGLTPDGFGLSEGFGNNIDK